MKKSKRVEAEDRPAEPVVDAESFGTWLRRQREGRDIGLREISEQSKISLRYLQALESGRFDILPAPVFAKGFLRQYARYVGLDPEEVVNAYLAARSATEEDDLEDDLTGTRATIPNGRRRNLGLVLGILVLLLLLALVYLAERWRRSDAAEVPVASAAATRAPAEQAAPPSPVPAVARARPQPAPVPPPAPAAPIVVDVDFTGECWVEARVDGKRALSETRVQGETAQFLAHQQVELRFGDAGVVTVEVNGRAFPIQARPGRVETVLIDLETVRGIEAGASP